MLNTGAKLRFLGIDMHARWRRRIVIVATYAAFFVGMLVIMSGTWNAFGHPCWAMWGLSILIAFTGIFRDGGLVKNFDEPNRLPRQAVRVGSLDEWARYKYGTDGFEESSAEQQEALLKSYRVGTYLMPPKGSRENRPWLPDEREAGERDSASRRALVVLSTYLACTIGVYSHHSTGMTSTQEVVALLLQFFVLSRTLPKTIVLWEEPDPRNVGRELELIGKKA